MGIGEVFQYINAIPDVAVYVLVDVDTKKVYINHSTKLRSRLGDISDLMVGYGEFHFFSVPRHPVYKLIIAEKIRTQYINDGYTIVNQKVPFIKFKAKSRVGAIYGRVFVYIESSRGHREIVGVFRKVSEADSFIAQYYGSEWSGAPIYALTRDTRDYLLNDVYKRAYGGTDSIFVESSESVAANDSE